MSTEEIPQKGDHILFIDVESLPAEKLDPLWIQLSSRVSFLPGESPEARLIRLEEIRRDTALNASLGRAWMVGIALGSGDPQLLIEDGSHEGEKRLLEKLLLEISKLENPWFVGHNIQGYDIPFLQVRSLHHGLPFLARALGRFKTKPWESRILDTQKIWPRTGSDRSAWRDGLEGLARLDTICAVLGIPQQHGVMGNSVYEAYLAGDAKGVAEHLDADIRQVRDVFRKLWPIL